MADPSIDEVSKADWDGLTASEKEAIREQVEAVSSTGWSQMTDTRKDEIIRQAIAERDSVYEGRMSRLDIIEGDEEYFTVNLAAHKLELASGGEAQSESGEGGSVSYVSGGGADEYLRQTRYGRTALRYVRTGASISVVRTY